MVKLVTPTELQRMRRRIGMTQTAFAAEMGVDPSTVSLWESGKRRITHLSSGAIRAAVERVERRLDREAVRA